MKKTAKKVLIVEDSKSINIMLVQSITSQLHIDVESALSLAEAKDLIDKNKDNFFVAVVDLNLPDASDGEIVDLVLENSIPPIILTGSMSDSLHKEMLEKPIIDYVVKRNLNEFEYVIETIKRLRDNQNRKILVVDDSRSSRDLIASLLQRHNLTILKAADGVEALDVIGQNKDMLMVVTDFNMPKMDGMELTSKIRESYSRSELAIIGISTAGDGTTSVNLLKSGANDFITRPFLHEEFFCRINQNIDVIVNYRLLKESSEKDFLTGLYNRKYFFFAGEKLFQNAKRKNLTLMVSMIDIDFFKKINDTYGHHIGDLAIQHVSAMFSKRVRDSDIVSRFGGEEFCVLCTNINDLDALKLLEAIRKSIEETPLIAEGLTIEIKVSIGFTIKLTDSLDGMVNDADAALYTAKESGRNQVVRFE